MHLAIIMDGNGRWATRQGLPRLSGHEAGAARLKEVIGLAARQVAYLSVYAFSIQNWSRPKAEILGLLAIARAYYADVPYLQEHNIRLRTQGYLAVYPADLQQLIRAAVFATATNTGLVLTIVLSYGGREEIVDTVNRLLLEKKEQVTVAEFAAALNPERVPDPDLIIRTSGEVRTSNFLLWQSAYSEYLFVDTLWPDFDESALQAALRHYARRERRYGGLPAALGGALEPATLEPATLEPALGAERPFPPDLGVFDADTIGAGLADTPAAAAHFGNLLQPGASVWLEFCYILLQLQERQLEQEHDADDDDDDVRLLSVIDLHRALQRLAPTAQEEERLKELVLQMSESELARLRLKRGHPEKYFYVLQAFPAAWAIPLGALMAPGLRTQVCRRHAGLFHYLCR